MSAAEKLGQIVESRLAGDPKKARGWLRAGWEAENVLFHIAPHKELAPADRYLQQLMMGTMLAPLRHPEGSAMVSIFVPCEMMQEVELVPYSAEAFSCYLSASFCEGACLERAEEEGISDTLCSYHRTFLGAAEAGLLRAPKCIVYTNVTCDANLLTFRKMAEFYQVPAFYLEVPMDVSEASVTYVERQMRELKAFLEKTTGKTISESALCERVARSKTSLETFRKVQQTKADRYVPTDLVTPFYSALTANLLLGTEGEQHYVEMALQDAQNAPAKRGKHIYWMHTIPFYSQAVKDRFLFTESAQIVGDELSQVCFSDFDPSNPYRAMAKRLVTNAMNGPSRRRIQKGIDNAADAKADGVIWFNHWGCKHTLGIAELGRQQFEAAGFPTLVIDGDGCDKSKEGEGQIATRIGAFLEMLDRKEATA